MSSAKRKSADQVGTADTTKKRRTASGAVQQSTPASKDKAKKVSKKGPASKQEPATEPKTAKADKKAEIEAKKEKRKPLLALVKDCVHIWEDLRPRDASAAKKAELVAKVAKLAKGKFKELSMNHASSRVVQAVLKHGSDADRKVVWADCREHIVEMAQSPHGNHVVRKLIAMADKDERSGILRACKGQVVKMFRHPCSAAVVSDLYDELGASERNVMVAEFYSKEYSLFGSAQSAAGQLSSLVDAWPAMDGNKRRAVMQHLILALQPIIEKGYVDAAAIHRLVSEYMQLAPSDMLQDNVEMLCGEAVLRMVHTHDGARVGCMVAGYGTPKDRKKLVKAIKGNVLKMCLDEFAYVPLIKVLQSVDDTQLVRKNIVQELLDSLDEVVASKHGVKVLQSLLQPCDKHLPPHAVKLLHPPQRTILVTLPAAADAGEAGDEAAAERPRVEQVMGVCKKDPTLRRRELLGHGEGSLAAALLTHCAATAAPLMRTAHGADMAAELCCGETGDWLWEHSRGAVQELHAAVAAAAGAAAPDGPAVEGPALPQQDEGLLANWFASRSLRRMVSKQSTPASQAFAACLWERALRGRCAELVSAHAGKVIAALVEHAASPVREQAAEELQGCVADVAEWCLQFHKQPAPKAKAAKAKA